MLFVSARHFRTKRREKGHTAALLSVLGIAAGVMTLISVLAVMNGFQLGTIEDILEVGSFHLRVEATAAEVGQMTVPAQTARRLEDVRGIRTAVPFADTFALAYGYFPDPLAIQIRAVPPDLLQRDPRFAANLEIVSGRWDLDGSSIVVGQELARRLGARVGDQLEIVGFSGNLASAGAERTTLDLIGVFRTGFLEYDTGWGFVAVPGAGDATGDGSSVGGSMGSAAGALGIAGAELVGVKLDDRFADRAVARRIEAVLAEAGIDGAVAIDSWRDFNRAIFGALRLEKTIMMLLVGLIFVVVGVNIYQALRRSVAERTEEIGVLKAIGAAPRTLRLVFVMEGLWVGLAGGIGGLVLGLLVSFNINAIFAATEAVVNGVGAAAGWVARLFCGGASDGVGSFAIFSPAYFYLEEVPAVVVPAEAAGVVLFAIASATIAAWAASARVSAISPAEVLRYE